MNKPRVIVAGGRWYGCPADGKTGEQAASEARHVYHMLRMIDPSVIVQGGAAGADGIARHVGRHLLKCKVETHRPWPGKGMPAWAALKARNQRMVDLGADEVATFPGGSGTADLIERSEAAGIPVVRFTLECSALASCRCPVCVAIAWKGYVDMRRASGDVICEPCGREYRKHPSVGPKCSAGAQWLHKLCDGSLVKL